VRQSIALLSETPATAMMAACCCGGSWHVLARSVAVLCKNLKVL